MKRLFKLALFALVFTSCDKEPKYKVFTSTSYLYVYAGSNSEFTLHQVHSDGAESKETINENHTPFILKIDSLISTPWLDRAFMESRFNQLNVFKIENCDTLRVPGLNLYDVESYDYHSSVWYEGYNVIGDTGYNHIDFVYMMGLGEDDFE